MLFILKKMVVILVFILQYDNAISQNYMGFKIKDVIMIKGADFTKKNDNIVYEKSNDRFIKIGTSIESFGYDNNNIVIRCFRFDFVDEDEILKIVKANNQEYKRVDIGNKQDFFQWIDTKNSFNFTLNIIPIEKGVVGNVKFYMIDYEITKE